MLVTESRHRCPEMAADDLVPLFTLSLLGAHIEHRAFESFLLERMLPEVLEHGQEGYCACTACVAMCFLRELRLEGDTR